MEGVIEQKVRAGWQEPSWQEHFSAMPGRGGFSQIVWDMVEPKGELLLAGERNNGFLGSCVYNMQKSPQETMGPWDRAASE